MKGLCRIGIAIVASLATGMSARAGLLDDWGITVADNGGSNYGVPSGQGQKSLGGGATLLYHLEDTDDTKGHSFFLGPEHGGQDYDAEFMGVVFDGIHLRVAVVTGQRPDNGFANFAPGDIRIETSAGVFGVEVGGGNGGGVGTNVSKGDPGTTYGLNSSGYTVAVTPNGATQTAGSVWKDSQWIQDPIVPYGPTQLQFIGGTRVGEADYLYTRNSLTTQHAVIEFTLDAGALIGGGVLIESIHWRPGCGNDELDVTVNRHVAPEASTLASWSVVILLGTAGIWKKRRAAKR